MLKLISRRTKSGSKSVYDGYYLQSEDGNIECYSPAWIRKYLGEQSNRIQGLKLSSDGKILLDNGSSKLDSYSVYTGIQLQNHRNIRKSLKERYAVERIFDFCTDGSEDERICGVVGIRGVGKSIALLHTIDRLNDYSNTVYIEIVKDITMEQLLHIIEIYKNFKYIFIDEITRVKDFVKNAHYISSRYAGMGNKIVVSGTDSYAIQSTLLDSLVHRIILVRMGYISYEEQKYLEKISTDDYLRYGGILDNELRRLHKDTTEVLEELVIENIVNSIARNFEYYKEKVLLPIDCFDMDLATLKTDIRSSVFYVYYTIIVKSLHGVKNLSLEKYYIKTGDIGEREIEQEFLDSVGVIPRIDKELTKYIIKILMDMDLIIGVSNLDKPSECRYYITTPSIAYKLYSDFLNFRTSKNYQAKVAQELFESVVLCNVADIVGKIWYYSHNEGSDGNREVDVVCRLNNGKYAFIEAKAGKNFKRCLKRASSLISCDMEYVGEKLIVFRKNFTELNKSKRLNIRTQEVVKGVSQLVEGESDITHLDNLRAVLKEYYLKSREDSEDDLFSSDWDL